MVCTSDIRAKASSSALFSCFTLNFRFEEPDAAPPPFVRSSDHNTRADGRTQLLRRSSRTEDDQQDDKDNRVPGRMHRVSAMRRDGVLHTSARRGVLLREVHRSERHAVLQGLMVVRRPFELAVPVARRDAITSSARRFSNPAPART